MACGAVGKGDEQVLRVCQVIDIELTKNLPAIAHKRAGAITKEASHLLDTIGVGVVGLSAVFAKALEVGLHPYGLIRIGQGILLRQQLSYGVGIVFRAVASESAQRHLHEKQGKEK